MKVLTETQLSRLVGWVKWMVGNLSASPSSPTQSPETADAADLAALWSSQRVLPKCYMDVSRALGEYNNIFDRADSGEEFIDPAVKEEMVYAPLFDFVSEDGTRALTTTVSMFAGAVNLVAVPGYFTSAVTDMSHMFEGCTSLRLVGRMDMSSVVDTAQMFYGCSSLERVPEMNTSAVSDVTYMFEDCTCLRRIESIDFGAMPETMGFVEGCSNLTYMLIRNIGGNKDEIDSGADLPRAKRMNFFGAPQWGAESEENRRSLVDSLLTYSFDRKRHFVEFNGTDAGFIEMEIEIDPEVLARLTDDEAAQIEAKGYVLTSY